MYKFHYEETLMDDGSRQKDWERQAIEHSINLLRKAQNSGSNSIERIEALAFINRLWSYLLENLAHADNGLSPQIRAKLISIGIWLIREADAIGDERSNNLNGLIDVSQTIAEGLR